MSRAKKTAPPNHCPQCKRGTLFNVSTRLETACGVQSYRCDRCGVKFAARYKQNQ